jgi:hypothetical protein
VCWAALAGLRQGLEIANNRIGDAGQPATPLAPRRRSMKWRREVGVLETEAACCSILDLLSSKVQA